MRSVQHISSLRNSKVKMVRSLKRKKGRTDEKAFLVEGFRASSEVIDSPCQIRLVFVEEETMQTDDRIQGLVEEISHKAPVLITTSRVMESLSDTESPQGIVAAIEQPLEDIDQLLKRGRTTLLAAAGVSDPGNLGTIIRTTEAFDLQGLVSFPHTVDLFNPKTVRSTAGAIFHLPLAEVDSYEKGIRAMEAADFRLVGTKIKGGLALHRSNLQGPQVLFAGNEARGLPENLEASLDFTISIDMPGDMESLNVSVAMGIVMYEVSRQRYV